MCGRKARGALRIGNAVRAEPLAVAARAGDEVASIREATQPVGHEGAGASIVGLAPCPSNRPLCHRSRECNCATGACYRRHRCGVSDGDEAMRKVVKLDELSPEEAALTPRYAQRALTETIPKYELGETGMDPDTAYQLIHDELLLDGSSRLNLATFVSTWMEPQAEKLMTECFAKNMIDKDEYPQTAEIENRCINMISRLFHAPDEGAGVSTVGSSEAVMLAGLALK